jgi:hypothetical protein
MHPARDDLSSSVPWLFPHLQSVIFDATLFRSFNIRPDHSVNLHEIRPDGKLSCDSHSAWDKSGPRPLVERKWMESEPARAGIRHDRDVWQVGTPQIGGSYSLIVRWIKETYNISIVLAAPN